VRLVVRDDDKALPEIASRLGADVVATSKAHLGMGHSLSSGFEHLTWDWAFVGLLDMPYVLVSTLRRLKAAALDLADETATIIRPRTADQPPIYGHPIGWHSTHFAAIRTSTGDEGARRLLKAHQESILEVTVDDEGIFQDVDIPGDVR
jgi:molybdenum cofactor cytidylyltransferase